MKYLWIILAIFLVACSSVPKEVPDEPDEMIEEEPAAESAPEEPLSLAEEPKNLTCEDYAESYFPDRITFTLAYSNDPKVDGWELVQNQTWNDGTPLETKGDIEFSKGNKEGESTQLWYTRNIQNEKLFGEGGLKYDKKVTDEEGISRRQRMIVKPVFKEIKVNYNPDPFKPYTGTFDFKEFGFVECEGFIE